MLLIGWQAVMLATFALAAYAWALRVYGEGSHARTIALFAIIGVQLGHMFNCRSRTRSAFSALFRNPFLWVATVIVVSLQLLAIYFSPLAKVLGTVHLLTVDWLIVAVCTIAPIVVVECTKALGRRQKKYGV